MTKTFTIDGHKIRTASNRRFVVVAVRSEDIRIERDESMSVHMGRSVDHMGRAAGTFVRFIRIDKRTDSIATARTFARRAAQRGDSGRGVRFAIVDTVTGEEV